MQIVSDNWKNAHRQTILDESYVEISFDVSDPEAQQDATPSDNGAIYISDSSELTNGIDKSPVPYCTLEQNIWLLDNKREVIEATRRKDEGYVSDVLSDEQCMFVGKIPTITLEFKKEFTALVPGITITWSTTYGEYATDFIVRAYKGDTVVAEKEILDNHSIKSLVYVDIANYNRIIIYVKKWCLPHHRARVEDIIVGINKVYSKGDLFSYSHKHSVSPVSTSLPKSEIQFSINNVDGEYNPYNENGMAKYLMERQEVKARYGLKMKDGTIEWIKGGVFYLSEWSAKQNGLTADFTARDLLEFLSDTYEEPYTLDIRSLYIVALELLGLADLPLNANGTVKWVIDDSLDSKYTSAPLPRGETIANCLQLIANAGECVLYQDRDGIIHIEPLKDEETDYSITSFNSYSKPEITLSKPIKQVDVRVYSYTYNKGEGTMDSTHTTVSVNVGTSGETIVVDNPLITDTGRAQAVGNWLATHLGHRKTLDSSWRADVRLDPLDIITNETAYSTHKVRMTDVEFKYNGAFRGTGKGKVI